MRLSGPHYLRLQFEDVKDGRFGIVPWVGYDRPRLCLRNRNTFESALPNLLAMIASNPIRSTIGKCRFRQRVILPKSEFDSNRFLVYVHTDTMCGLPDYVEEV
jgi:hypothetical protein